ISPQDPVTKTWNVHKSILRSYYSCLDSAGSYRGFLAPCMLVRGCQKPCGRPQGVQREPLDSARRRSDRDDHDREPAICLDFIYRSHHSGYRLETLRYPMGLDAVYRLGNLGDAFLRLDH